MTDRSREELERALGAAERRAAELQAWVDSSEADAERLNARITELEARPAGGSGGASAELQAWLDASEAEVEKLRAEVAELKSKPAVPSGGGASAELQAWLDASEAEVEKLRAEVTELKSKPAAPSGGGASAELQAWLDASEAEVEKLRAEVTELKSKPATPSGGGASAELQVWLDASEAEVEKLRAEVAELKSKPAAPSGGGAAAELQVWLDASEAENEKLRAEVSELKSKPVVAPPGGGASAELQAWLDASEADADKLRETVAELQKEVAAAKALAEKRRLEGEAEHLHALDEEKHAKKDEKAANELQQWLDAAEAENEELRNKLSVAEPELKHLREQVGELETAAASLREMNKRFSGQVEASAHRDVERLRSELEEARKNGASDKVEELAATLSNAREAIATLESERSSALNQVHRYAQRDTELERKTKAELESIAAEKDARIAVLQASLNRREEELKTVEARLHAYVASETSLKTEVERIRISECESREQLGHVRTERETLEAKCRDLEHELATTKSKLDETKEWLDRSEAENEKLEKTLEAARLDHAMRVTELAAANQQVAQLKSTQTTKPTIATPDDPESTEGYSLARLHRLESLLTTEQQRADTLQGLVKLADRAVTSMRDELEGAQGRLKDLLKKLGLSGEEFDEALGRLDSTQRELHALKKELSASLEAPKPPPPPLDAFDDVPPQAEDVLSAPLDAMSALSDAQAQATKQATEALQSDARAREQTISDLSWLKAELDKVSHVRDDLRTRLAAMVQRELKRKTVMNGLLERLRQSEVATASRLGAVRRLQAAIELAQRNAVKVQTIYFQKQIGSLQRQLEVAMKKRRADPVVAQKSTGSTKAVPLAVPDR